MSDPGRPSKSTPHGYTGTLGAVLIPMRALNAEEEASVVAWLSERYGLVLPAGTTLDALCGEILRGCDEPDDAEEVPGE